jgi:NTP pyrophosphatase (non-canonical NTP hydrolase)
LKSLWFISVGSIKTVLVNHLSLTLRDAQHLCWKNFKKINDTLDPEKGKGWTPFVMVTDLLEEAGEVASVVKGLEGFKPLDKPKTKEMMATELSDLLYIIFILAEQYGIELEEAFMQTVNDKIISMLG